MNSSVMPQYLPRASGRGPLNTARPSPSLASCYAMLDDLIQSGRRFDPEAVFARAQE